MRGQLTIRFNAVASTFASSFPITAASDVTIFARSISVIEATTAPNPPVGDNARAQMANEEQETKRISPESHGNHAQAGETIFQVDVFARVAGWPGGCTLLLAAAGWWGGHCFCHTPFRSVVGMTSREEDRLFGERPGPVYDNAWRLLFEGSAAAVAAFVTGEPFSSFGDAKFVPTDLPGATVSADALIEVEGRRLHVELQLRAEAARFEPRLVAYWARLNAMGEVPFEQHVIVMNSDGGRLSGLYRKGRLRLEYFVHHLWDLPVEGFLAHESLLLCLLVRETLLRGEWCFRRLSRKPNLLLVQAEMAAPLGTRLLMQCARLRSR